MKLNYQALTSEKNELKRLLKKHFDEDELSEDFHGFSYFAESGDNSFNGEIQIVNDGSYGVYFLRDEKINIIKEVEASPVSTLVKMLVDDYTAWKKEQ